MHFQTKFLLLSNFFYLYFSITGSTKSKPNIVFMLADDYGWNDVGFHGSTQVKTPTLDNMAKEGVILNNYYLQQLCSPSRAALLTGRYPIRTGMQYFLIEAGQRLGVPLNFKFMPEYLNELGYESHMVGKWHLGMFNKNYTPTYRGFKTFLGYYNGYTDYFDHRTREPPEGMDPNEWWGLDWNFNEGENLTSINSDFGKYGTHVMQNRANDVIKGHDFNSKPLFLYLPFQNVHSGNDVDPIQVPIEVEMQHPNIWNTLRRKYVGVVQELDNAVRNITETLSNVGVLNNTIIIFSTDNGGAPNGFENNMGSNFPLRSGKGYYFEGGIRGSAFVFGPMFKNRAGNVSTDLMHVTDWLPTLYEAAGGSVSDLGDVDGHSMWSVLTGVNKTCPRMEVLVNINPINNSKAIRVGKYKYLLNPYDVMDAEFDHWFRAPGELPDTFDVVEPNNTPAQIWCGKIPANVDTKCHSESTGQDECIFDIENDPCEYYNLVDNPDYKSVKAMLLDRLDYWDNKSVQPLVPPYDPEGSPAKLGFVFKPWTDNATIPNNRNDIEIPNESNPNEVK